MIHQPGLRACLLRNQGYRDGSRSFTKIMSLLFGEVCMYVISWGPSRLNPSDVDAMMWHHISVFRISWRRYYAPSFCVSAKQSKKERPVRQPCDHSGKVKPIRIAILYSAETPRRIVAVNHTQIART
ncbi:hypothetical protein HID58_085912 [Brassica napus]|uniref:Uncharacterized protein n=1 Tax=Brassica napus TaxID=3708 RepID=A0ABQ7XRF5_BRANA|nr:hypothetical protein HID58_085912 [Brassica napus]